MVRGGSFPFFWLRCMCACTQCAHQPLLELRRRQPPSFDPFAPPGVGRVRRWLGWVGVGGGRDPLKSERKGRSVRLTPSPRCVRMHQSRGLEKWEGGWWVITGSPPAAGTGLMQLLPHFSVSKGDRSFPLGASGEARGKCAHSYAL